MALFTEETISRVRDAADLVELVSAHTELRSQGGRHTGLCPFHEERTPSFSVNGPDKLYHCFGCGVGGDLFDFVMEIEGIEFPEAVERLAERYGIDVVREKEDPEAERRRAERARLGELLDRVAAFYARVLESGDEARKARTYLEGRGLKTETLAKFGVGYAPNAWDTLIMRGQRVGFKVPELARAGLVQKGNKGGFYDRFRGRITFPIRDDRDRVIGFGARAMRPAQKPKYLNSPESEMFHKSDVLYGIDLARWAIGKTGRAVLVEGYTDVIALHQIGLEEAVGVMGTSVTESQLTRLSARTDTLILALDADSAGREAMLRAGEIAARRRLRILVAALPAGTDPAEMVTADGGAEEFRKLLDSAVELSEFHLDMIIGSGEEVSPQERDRRLSEAAPVLAAIPEGAARQELIRRTAGRLGIEPEVVSTRVAGAGQGGEEQPATPAAGEAAPRAGRLLTKRERIERSLLAMCVSRPEEGRVWLERLQPEHLSSPLIQRTVEWLSGHLDQPAEGLDPDDTELRRLVAALVAAADPDRVGRGSLQRNFRELELLALEDRIREAAEQGDDAARMELLKERSRLVDAVRRAEAEGETEA